MTKKIFSFNPPGLDVSIRAQGNARWSNAFRLVTRFFPLLVLFVIILTPALQARTSETGEITATTPGIKAFSINAAPVFQLGSKVNGGGSVSVNNLNLNGSGIYQLTEHFGTGISLFYNLSRFRFTGVNAIPLAKPWGTVQNYGVDIPLIFSLSKKWQVIVVPIVQYSGENGATWGSSLIYGGLGSVNYNWGKANYLNVGVAGFHWIGETDFFPFVDFNWHITDRWRLSTPLPTGPVGPGGLKLSYGLTPHWEIGLAGGYRFNRFRLDKHGSLPNGIGQYSQLPVAAVITYTYSLVNLNVFGGVSFDNKIWLETSDGSGIYRADQKPAPLVGFNLSIGVVPSQFRAYPWQIRQYKNFLR